MKKTLLALMFLTLALHLPAQTNGPVRLALIAETDEASPALDILTAELSSRTNLQLLERSEINKVYQEQNLSAGNQDYVKLGRILGADGLLLMSGGKEGTNESLSVRLVAVKPGVVLLNERIVWPAGAPMEWAPFFAIHLDLYLPKLSVTPKDAIPVSIVNLRAAVSSAESLETERQLKLLAIERLVHEPQIFVLERQQMQLLGTEKELKQDESPFWDGSYLLEGVVDQNGFSTEKISINARLTPPNGGAPVLLEISGSRTNLPDVVDQLVLKVREALKINTKVKEWNAAEEAKQYFNEAEWAMRWGVSAEARAAADSAWALGKNDQECVQVRIRAYLSEIPTVVAPNVSLGAMYSGSPDVNYVHITDPPDPKYCDVALDALNFYHNFMLHAPDGGPSMRRNVPNDPDQWYNSDWYQLGLDDLTAASSVLKHFNYALQTQKLKPDVMERLGELRVRTRAVAGLISQSPGVHDSYYVGSDRLVVYDEFYHFDEKPSIFEVKVEDGSLWQESPEDGVALYRELMASPIFCCIHDHFWVRGDRFSLATPRLAAWNEADQKNIPTVWNNFVQELEDSTNVLWRLEGKALRLADATNDAGMGTAFTNFFEAFSANRDAIFANNVDVLYLQWNTGDLMEHLGENYKHEPGEDVYIPIKDTLNRLYYSKYRRELEAMDKDYVTTKHRNQFFEKQMAYLKQNTPYDFFKFSETFSEKNYSGAQALEMRPQLATYKSNLVAQSQNATGRQKAELKSAIFFVEKVQADVDKVIAPPTEVAQPVPPHPAPVATILKPTAPAPEVITNIMTVDKFQAIPLDDLRQASGLHDIKESQVSITAHQWLEDKLVLNFEFDFYGFEGAWPGNAIAVFDPANEHWEVIDCPQTARSIANPNYYRTTLWHGELYDSDKGQIKKYDRAGGQWQNLPISDGVDYELFNVNEHLYAGNRDVIFEILEGGKSTHILASKRRQPPASTLDTQSLENLFLFAGPEHSLRASAGGKIYAWTGNDWHEEFAAPPASLPPEGVADGLMFRREDGDEPSLSFLATTTLTNRPELYFWQRIHQPGVILSSWTLAHRPPDPTPLWKMPPNLVLANLAATRYKSEVYLLADHSERQTGFDPHIGSSCDKIVPVDGYHAVLWDFAPDFPKPKKILLKFTVADGCPPVDADNSMIMMNLPPTWMLCTSNYLLCGLEQPNDPKRSILNPLNTSGYRPGIWQIPLERIRAVTDRQKQNQLDQMNEIKTKRGKIWPNLLTKYDHNHNGVIDLPEREEALDDPDFIEAELDMIDTNHNGRLDAPELAYFDANQNKILDPKEQAGIDIAQRLLAARLLEKFDTGGKGYLEPPEFDEAIQAGKNPNDIAMQRAMQSLGSHEFADANHDGRIDAGELEAYLKKQMRAGLRIPHRLGMMINPPMNRPSQPVDPRQAFKSAVEAYWNNTNNITNQFPPNSVR